MYFHVSPKSNQLLVSWSFVKGKGNAPLRVVKSVISWGFKHCCHEVHVAHARTCIGPLSVGGDQGAKRWFIMIVLVKLGLELMNFEIDYASSTNKP